MTLRDLKAGQTATILSVGGEGALRQHFLDMGLIQGTEVTVIKYAPMGDPVELRLHGYELTIRLADAEQIEVKQSVTNDTQTTARGVLLQRENMSQRKNDNCAKPHKPRRPHPGYGEGGKYHDKKTEHPLPENETLTFALVGNQNCGKTTLFNQLTGSNQHVGNFPGVTVDRKDGVIKGFPNTRLTDLPGIYSMSPYSDEEIVTREFLLEEKPRGIINIVDATNIERNLYLTMQLMELHMPMVVALNMMDEVHANSGAVLVNELEEFLGVPVVPISAAKGEGIDELMSHALHVAKYQERPIEVDFCSAGGEESDADAALQGGNLKGGDWQGAVHRTIHAIMHLIEDHAKKEEIPLRFAASKVAENDKLVIDRLHLTENEKETLEHLSLQMEEESGMDRASAIAGMRFSYIQKACAATVIKPQESKEHIRSGRIDALLTGKYTGIPMFIGIMGLVFYLTFNVIGAGLQSLLETGVEWVIGLADSAMTQMHVNAALHSLVIDGVFNGVGSVLSFLPIIVTLFFFLSMLEDSGYMARVAFIMDKLLRRIGLSGRSIVPMLIGFGCTVPGVMASRTLSSERDRKMTILLTPFMSCTAKLPIYAFFTAAFFPEHGGLVMIALYVGGIVMGILAALIFKNTLFRGEPVPFVMELPNYRMPGAKNVGQLLWEKAKDFLQRAFTVIFVATIVIWFLQNFDIRLNMVTDAQDSILAAVSGVIAPIFAPLGFGSWEITTSLITGFMAKESVVSTLSVLFGSTEVLTGMLTTAGASALLVFCLLYTPCVAAIASIKRELGAKWALFVAVGQCVIAWLAAFVVHLLFLVIK